MMLRTAGQLFPAFFRTKQATRLLGGLLLIVAVPLLLASQISCVAPGNMPTYSAQPPREELQASLAQEPIKASDVLQVKLPDGSKASVSETFIVAPDGTIEVHGQGRVQVAGKTLQQAQEAIQAAMAASDAAQQAIELAMSEYYLVSIDTNGVKRLTRVPIKGEVRVADALAHVRTNDKIIWILRPDRSRYLSEQTLPVDWETVSRDRNNRTNYKLQSGDWLFVQDEPAGGVARVFNALTALPQPDTSRAR